MRLVHEDRVIRAPGPCDSCIRTVLFVQQDRAVRAAGPFGSRDVPLRLARRPPGLRSHTLSSIPPEFGRLAPVTRALCRNTFGANVLRFS